MDVSVTPDASRAVLTEWNEAGGHARLPPIMPAASLSTLSPRHSGLNLRCARSFAMRSLSCSNRARKLASCSRLRSCCWKW